MAGCAFLGIGHIRPFPCSALKPAFTPGGLHFADIFRRLRRFDRTVHRTYDDVRCALPTVRRDQGDNLEVLRTV
jgi:hypothetical protein